MDLQDGKKATRDATVPVGIVQKGRERGFARPEVLHLTVHRYNTIIDCERCAVVCANSAYIKWRQRVGTYPIQQ